MNNHLLRYIGSFTRMIQSLCDEKYQPLELQKGQFMYLMRICEHPGISQAELTELLSVDKSSTTKALQKLEKSGYVDRRKSTSDARKTLVYATSQGLKVYPELARYELYLLKFVNKALKEINSFDYVDASEFLSNYLKDHYLSLRAKDQRLEISLVDSQEQLQSCFFVRTEVFHKEQGVDTALDFDGKDESADNYLAFFNGEIAATMRLRDIGTGTLKLERLAVLPKFRRLAIASAMVEFATVSALDKKYDKKYDRIILHAQVSAIELYIKAGYSKLGEEFMEAGIRHQEMERQL